MTIDYAVGDELSLLVPLINLDKSDEILFDKGTIVKITSIKGSDIYLTFPDNEVRKHDGKDLPFIFNKITEGKLLTINHAGVGTPPKEFFKYLPNGSDWKKNYVWKVYISLEERNDKHFVCQICSSEITDFNKKNTSEDIYCPTCKEYIVPFDLIKNEPWLNINK